MSILVLLILGVTGWLGGELSFRHGIGVATTIGKPPISAQGEGSPNA